MTIRIREVKSRDEWLRWRRSNINASEVGAIMGIDKYRTPLQVHHDKLGNLVSEDNNIMRRGRWLEPAIMKAIQEIHPDWAIEQQVHYYDDPALRIGCTPDFFAKRPDIHGLGLVQGKVIEQQIFDREWRDGDSIVAPISYQIQTMIEAKFVGASWAQLGVLVVGRFYADLIEVPVEIHDGAWGKVKEAVAEFWARFDKGKEPALDPERDGDLIKALYLEDPTAGALDLSGDNELPGLLAEDDILSAAISMACKEIKPMEKEREAIRTQIKAKLGGASLAICQDRKITWKTECRKASQFRVLRIGKLKEDN